MAVKTNYTFKDLRTNEEYTVFDCNESIGIDIAKRHFGCKYKDIVLSNKSYYFPNYDHTIGKNC